ncbi:hypothetical protein EKO27_g7438 [Xylaria grammica]|uniref:Uncharacterized protein n=1 Tax=Xylaria grammica TaxID=363999 RepID=A0A439D039_9PEZI|nr:hypothetical protein EKO27_g7438 [Xylaria grammica]
MKSINERSERLTKAIKRIEELKKENKRLRVEVTTLRTPKPKTPASGSVKSPSPKGIPGYAQSTASSRNKEKSEPQEEEKNARKIPIIRVDEIPYSYKDGVPMKQFYPRYMKSTVSSIEHQRHLFPVYFRKPKPQAIKNDGWGSWSSPPHSPPPPKEAELPPTPPRSPTPISDLEDDLATKSRLYDNLDLGVRMQTDTRTNLGYLRKAAEIVQKSIFDAGNSGGLGQTHKGGLSVRLYADGPHLIRLGRDELISWIGRYPHPGLAYNGRSEYTIHATLLDVVPLRNAISHPSAWELLDSEYVDGLMRRAQDVTVVLGDEKGAMEIRTIRDSLRDDANRAWQTVKDIYWLSLLPQPGLDNLDFPYHLRDQLSTMARKPERYEGLNEEYELLYKELVAVAAAWGNTR